MSCYGRRWSDASAAFLLKHPTCVVCGEGGADSVDHRVPHHGDNELMWNRNNWQSMHRRCHSRKTRQDDTGVPMRAAPSSFDSIGAPLSPLHHWNAEG